MTTRGAKSSNTIVRGAVTDFFKRSRSFARLPPKLKTQITQDTTSIAGYLTDTRGGTDAFRELVEKVGFPEFVANLLKGTFEAIVDSSIRQMEAYAEMIAAVSKSVEQFRDENITENQARDHLAESFPKFFKLEPRRPLPKLKPKQKPATRRQQLLATMVMMGIIRIAATGGKIKRKR